MRCIIIEDQAPARRVLQKYVNDYGKLELKECFSSATEARTYLETAAVDLIFLDIHLPELSGLDFLRSLEKPPAVILTTAFDEYAMDGYELDIVDYLLKPFSYARFCISVEKATQRISAQNRLSKNDNFFIKSGRAYISVSRKDILYIHSDLDYTELHFETGKHIAQETLSYWEKSLHTFDFVRVHKSYMVNIASIDHIQGNRIYFSNGHSIPIGRAYKDDFITKHVKVTDN
ncbi:MAG: response regulator transcription factor [Flavobacteriales bacterium]|nr:response regulator transcription factor [Flavobacteriales bacterium]